MASGTLTGTLRISAARGEGQTASRAEHLRHGLLALGAAGALALALPARGEPVHTQTLTLNPGWSAIYLEVTPEPAEVASVFAGLPVVSVWQWQQTVGQVEFIADPAEGLLNREDWRSFFPDLSGGTPFLTNLFALRGNQAYLVRLGGTAIVPLTVTGRPSLRPTQWVPDSFNLVGFHLDPSAPPTVADYFSPSPAHAGQPVYTLGAGGVWQLMSPSQNLASGRSYWVFTEGKSEFQGPLEIFPPTADGLEFGSAIVYHGLTYRNHSGNPTDVTLDLLPSADGSALPALAHWQLDAEGTTIWPLLPSPYDVAVDGGGERNTPIAVRRAGITTAGVAGLLEVSDGAGCRYLVPVAASPPQPAAGAPPLGDFTGLWVGSATVDKVSEVRRNVQRVCPCPNPPSGLCPAAVDGSVEACQDDGAGPFCTTGPDSQCTLVEGGIETPIPARREFDLRLLVHSDDAGNARLLKEVTLMFQEGPDETTPGSFVLVTNDDRLSEFTGSALRDGVPVGTRVSSAAFDFPGTTLPLSGSVAPGGTLTGSIILEPDFPTNPFRHRFHPDHNQLDEQYQEFSGASRSRLFEEFTITRQLTLVLAPADPELEPEAGDSLLVGTYEETISGLHDQDVSVAGTLRLRRLSTVGSLQE